MEEWTDGLYYIILYYVLYLYSAVSSHLHLSLAVWSLVTYHQHTGPSSPLHVAVAADCVLSSRCVDAAVQRGHGHAASAVDQGRRSPPLVVLGTELLDRAGGVIAGPSADCSAAKTGTRSTTESHRYSFISHHHLKTAGRNGIPFEGHTHEERVVQSSEKCGDLKLPLIFMMGKASMCET